MELNIQLPITMPDSDLTDILNQLNHLGIAHHLINNDWWDRSLVLKVDNADHCHLLLGIKLGKLLNNH